MANFANADAITTYDLSATLDNGGDTLTLAGTFDYDLSNNIVSNWDLAISGPASAPFCGGAPSPCYTFEPGPGASASFTPDLFEFVGSSTDVLDIVPGISASPLPNGVYTLDSNSKLTTLSGGTGSAPFIDGTLSAETPEPHTLPIILAVTLLAILATRRRART